MFITSRLCTMLYNSIPYRSRYIRRINKVTWTIHSSSHNITYPTLPFTSIPSLSIPSSFIHSFQPRDDNNVLLLQCLAPLRLVNDIRESCIHRLPYCHTHCHGIHIVDNTYFFWDKWDKNTHYCNCYYYYH